MTPSTEIRQQTQSGLIEAGQTYPLWSPDRAFEAAVALLEAIDDEKSHQ